MKKIKRRIYLDAAAGQSNPSSLHHEGVVAASKLAQARSLVAQVLGARSDEVVFTSGGTESNNLAIQGVVQAGGHIVTTTLEHPSVLETCWALERAGRATVTYIEVGADGLVNLTDIKKALRPDTQLVSVCYAASEIGTIQPIREIAKIIRHFRKAKSYKLTANPYPYLHTDACQVALYLDLNTQQLGVDLLTLNGAKSLGGVGVGCLYARRGINLTPILFGGGQESGRRSGTENVAGITKFAHALVASQKDREKTSRRLIKLRDYFIKKLLKISGTSLNGSASSRLPNNVNVSFTGVEGEQVVLELDAKGVAASTSSACASRAGDDPRAILNANTVRFTLSPGTTKAELDYTLKTLEKILKKLRQFAII